MNRYHEVTGVSFEDDTLVLQVDGRTHRIRIAEPPRRLASASEMQRRRYEVSPSGYGIHWPDIDEDLSVDGLIGVHHTEPQRKSSTKIR